MDDTYDQFPKSIKICLIIKNIYSSHQGQKIEADGISKKANETESKIVRAQSKVIKGGPRVKRNITEQEVMEQVRNVCVLCTYLSFPH